MSESTAFLTELDAALEDDDYGDGDYGRNITAGDLWILANVPDHTRKLHHQIESVRHIHSGQHERLIGTVGSYQACDACGGEVPCPTLRAIR